jgi:hypothetical protein
MRWTTQNPKEWHTKFALMPARIAEREWIWLQKFEQRMVDSRWIGGDGAAFVFERRLPGGEVNQITIYRM